MWNKFWMTITPRLAFTALLNCTLNIIIHCIMQSYLMVILNYTVLSSPQIPMHNIAFNYIIHFLYFPLSLCWNLQWQAVSLSWSQLSSHLAKNLWQQLAIVIVISTLLSASSWNHLKCAEPERAFGHTQYYLQPAHLIP